MGKTRYRILGSILALVMALGTTTFFADSNQGINTDISFLNLPNSDNNPIVINVDDEDINKNYYSTNEQVEYIASKLNADMQYFTKINGNYMRLKHNNGEPIYVSLDGLNDRMKSLAIQALDYTFGVMSQINDNYRYEIVNYDELKGTYINFITTDLRENVDATAVRYISPSDAAGREFTSGGVVEISNSEITTNLPDERIVNILIHELTHFSVEDVYVEKIDKALGNTFINTYYGDTYGIYTPNDMKGFYALYSKPVPREEWDDLVSKIQEKIDQYTVFYHKNLVEKSKERLYSSEYGEVEDKELILEGDKTFQNQVHGIWYSHHFSYKIHLKDNVYNIKIFKGNEQIDETSGKYTIVDGVAILKDVMLKRGFAPTNEGEHDTTPNSGFISDVEIMRVKNITSGEYVVMHNTGSFYVYMNAQPEKNSNIQIDDGLEK